MSLASAPREYVLADLGAGTRVCATTRRGGASIGAWGSFNLGTHVHDEPSAVAKNRSLLSTDLGIEQIQWLDQVHGTIVVRADRSTVRSVPVADASFSTESRLALAVLTADCLPVVLATDEAVGVAHCGWRGLASGLLAALAGAMPGRLQAAWLGPGICGNCYQVDATLLDAFDRTHLARAVGDDAQEGKVRLSLASVADSQLAGMGCERIEHAPCCSLCDERFYSYRRDSITGRMATLVWRDSPEP